MRSVARLAAALALMAATWATALGSAPPASAAACASAGGATVVVDFKSLGGGVQQQCVAGGGRASDLFAAAGFALRYAQQQPGMVCRVEEKPADAGCVQAPPADAYWALWWSDGKSGSWAYSNQGVTSLTVPAGGSVAFAWSNGTRSAPGAPAQVHEVETSPTAAPSQHSGSTGTGAGSGGKKTGGDTGDRGAGGGAGTGSGSGAGPGTTSTAAVAPTSATSRTAGSTVPSAGASAAPGAPSATGSPSGSPEATVRDAVPSESPSMSVEDQQAQPAADVAEKGGLPTWVVLALVLVVFLAAGASVLVRRRRHAGS